MTEDNSSLKGKIIVIHKNSGGKYRSLKLRQEVAFLALP